MPASARWLLDLLAKRMKRRQMLLVSGESIWRSFPPAIKVRLTVRSGRIRSRLAMTVGDVWLASGQSNMEAWVGLAKNAEQEIADAKWPLIPDIDRAEHSCRRAGRHVSRCSVGAGQS